MGGLPGTMHVIGGNAQGIMKLGEVKWLNKELSKLWPLVTEIREAAELVIKESVEPLLEEYRPSEITSLKFSKLSLGDVAPKIEGMLE
ncbi:hypothetical protein Ddye_011940 [Dipteronia dyeriana]|uniref:SMP-LTD domain-containing protein n=1 Tax=Dipteronia dyeriana TaxID=168575 RepID=A0AAD9X3C8_9ROSI|nr:hypothetical protein Ddye_011940 [Dipteronia dyeriana]